MIEPLIGIIVMLLIALYRIANRKTDDPDEEAARALARGCDALNKYYKSRGE
jgi:hypothetical protein